MNEFILAGLGIDFDEETYNDFLKYVISKAQVHIKRGEYTYYNYYPQDEKNLQFVIEALQTNNKVEINDFDIHYAGSSVWKLKILNKMQNFSNSYMLTKENGDSLICAKLVNQHILDSKEEGNIIECQVCALALSVDIYKDEEEYENSVEKNANGEKYLVGEGQIIPVNLIVNNSTTLTKEERAKRDHDLDDMVLIKGKIKDANSYELKMLDTKMNPYLKANIDTEFGNLPIYFTYNTINQELVGFGTGNIIVAKAIISCDVAIYDYDKYKKMYRNTEKEAQKSIKHSDEARREYY